MPKRRSISIRERHAQIVTPCLLLRFLLDIHDRRDSRKFTFSFAPAYCTLPPWTRLFLNERFDLNGDRKGQLIARLLKNLLTNELRRQ